MQAALAADFSIKEFRDLKTLLFWHGRLSYIRSSLLVNFIIHRGFIISVIQFIFSCIFYYVSIPVFNSYLQLGYATIFTFWPVFALILDKDVNVLLILLSFKRRRITLVSTNPCRAQSTSLCGTSSCGCGRRPSRPALSSSSRWSSSRRTATWSFRPSPSRC